MFPHKQSATNYWNMLYMSFTTLKSHMMWSPQPDTRTLINIFSGNIWNSKKKKKKKKRTLWKAGLTTANPALWQFCTSLPWPFLSCQVITNGGSEQFSALTPKSGTNPRARMPPRSSSVAHTNIHRVHDSLKNENARGFFPFFNHSERLSRWPSKQGVLMLVFPCQIAGLQTKSYIQQTFHHELTQHTTAAFFFFWSLQLRSCFEVFSNISHHIYRTTTTIFLLLLRRPWLKGLKVIPAGWGSQAGQ